MSHEKSWSGVGSNWRIFGWSETPDLYGAEVDCGYHGCCGDSETMTPEQLRIFAAALVEAADYLETQTEGKAQ